MPANDSPTATATSCYPALEAGEVHVWLCPRHTREDSDKLRRDLLSRYAALPPQAWRFERGPWGKPVIANPAVPLEFNLSDSGDWLAFAVSAGVPLGVDLEQKQRARDVLRLARRFYHPGEIAALEQAQPGAACEALFYDLWTLKEAHVKCRGLALPPLLESVGFSCDEGGISRLGEEPDTSAYCLLRPRDDLRLALNVMLAPGQALRLRLLQLTASGPAPWPEPGLRAASQPLELLDGLPPTG
ncbi:4'-phosphopantetheinyl transferase superfamily protein [Mangrovimicrobium sediminis]|uniref:4'-phosphopantetheinyl transferase superfamily protein n=1 Tax=Mangrovimicrobium sediminis TaxID=2562682 RepID=A0A4Z0LW77_9GAMM|nr:4'-phosphopantetheinyl transferase superfamily protein [Haliea sp. SAOS-164]TGD71582.1 4'-phosphopantetheinyl transferase superfamily protein [Haliea sp. SAOS-164]